MPKSHIPKSAVRNPQSAIVKVFCLWNLEKGILEL